MRHEEAKEIFVKHSQLFDMVVHDNYVPSGSSNMIQEIWGAFLSMNPGYHMDWACGRCLIAMLEQANRIRMQYMTEKGLKFRTFPKQ